MDHYGLTPVNQSSLIASKMKGDQFGEFTSNLAITKKLRNIGMVNEQMTYRNSIFHVSEYLFSHSINTVPVLHEIA